MLAPVNGLEAPPRQPALCPMGVLLSLMPDVEAQCQVTLHPHSLAGCSETHLADPNGYDGLQQQLSWEELVI